MKNPKPTFYLAGILFLAACQSSEKKQTTDQEADTTPKEEVKAKDPCDSPKTVAELLACANSVGKVDSSAVSLGSDFNGTGCFKAWNDADTVLTLVYSDSISVWRVGEWVEVPDKLGGHWFTNFSAKAKGLTKEETINLFALNTCTNSDVYQTCVCTGPRVPADTVIQYEDQVRIKPGIPVQFGMVGKNLFGDGGAMQWKISYTKDAPFRLLSQEKW